MELSSNPCFQVLKIELPTALGRSLVAVKCTNRLLDKDFRKLSKYLHSYIIKHLVDDKTLQLSARDRYILLAPKSSGDCLLDCKLFDDGNGL